MLSGIQCVRHLAVESPEGEERFFPDSASPVDAYFLIIHSD